MLRFGSVRPLLACLVVAASCSLHAASPRRLAGAIDDARLASMPAHLPPAVMHSTDQGDAAADLPLKEMTLRFSMTDAQVAALDQLLADQQNPASERFRKWLTPEQFAGQFGLASEDLTKVTSWLTAQGFTVEQVGRGGTFVRFSGNAAQVRAAFHTQIRRFSLNGEQHFANSTAPKLPEALAAVTSGITGLHDFHPKPSHRELIVSSPEARGVVTQFTSETSGNHYIAPGDFYTIYNVQSLLQSGVDGTGVTIAVMGQTDIQLSDMAAFRSASGLSANLPTVKLYGSDPGTASTDDVTEASLDVEWSGAVAPNANILYVNSTDVIDGSLTQTIDNNLAPIISLSYGLCETAVGQADLTYYNNLMKMANAQGQTIFSASGDSGATDCDYHVASATQGLAVDFPAVLPTVTGVGGTMFNEGSGTYFSTTNGATQGSALSYIPEAAWNEDASGSLSSGGGGSSAYFTKPVWQVGTGVPQDSSRDVPDVSLNSAAGHDGYLICSGGFCTAGYRNAAGRLDVVGGTSVATPAFAGIMALLEQKIASRVGNANPTIYALANSTYYGGVFHDVSVGTNASPCTAGTTGCPSGGPIGYAAGAGYDRATGWGSVDAFNFVTAWSLVTPIPISGGTTLSATSLTESAKSVIAGASVTLTATVASGVKSSTVIPTGTVQFLVDGVQVGTPVALSSTGVATYTVDTTSLTGGSHVLQAAYSGDATFDGSKGLVTLDVTSANMPDFTLSPTTASVTTRSGSAASGIPFTVTAANGFTGNVTFTTTGSSGLSASYTLSPNPVTLSASTTSATATLNLFAYTSNSSSGLTQSSVRPPADAPWYRAGSGVVLAGVLLLVLPKRRRLAGLLTALLAVFALGATGCGSGGSTSSIGGGGTTILATTPGTYTVTVSASGTMNGATVTHKATVTFVVQ